MEQKDLIPREELFLDYVLGALDPSKKSSFEAQLVAHPDERVQVDRLRHSVGLLALDRDGLVEPADLAMRTIERVAAYVVATEPSHSSAEMLAPEMLQSINAEIKQAADRAPAPRAAALSVDACEISTVYRRNAIAAIGLTAAFLLLAFPLLAGLRQARNLETCRNNLREYSQALTHYADTHNDRFPQVGQQQTASHILMDLSRDGFLPSTAFLTCPGSGRPAVRVGLEGDLPENAAIDYAYALGYRDERGELQGLVHNSSEIDLSLSPIMSDAPTRQGSQAVPANHRCLHQVLFADGHVIRCTNGNVGYEQDNIFYNNFDQVSAGVRRVDAVLGRPEERP